MLVLDGVSKVFGHVRAVDAVSLGIPRGQFVGVIGRSGAGKSTLLRMINRLGEPTSGRIAWDGARRHRAARPRRCATGARAAR